MYFWRFFTLFWLLFLTLCLLWLLFYILFYINFFRSWLRSFSFLFWLVNLFTSFSFLSRLFSWLRLLGLYRRIIRLCLFFLLLNNLNIIRSFSYVQILEHLIIYIKAWITDRINVLCLISIAMLFGKWMKYIFWFNISLQWVLWIIYCLI